MRDPSGMGPGLPDLSQTSLSDQERRVLARLVELLAGQLGDELRGVWLFGSRARGEPPTYGDSDVDLLVVTRRDDSWEAAGRIEDVVDAAAATEGVSPVWYSAHVYSEARIAQRREIRSFFMQEVDRDKVVLVGEP